MFELPLPRTGRVGELSADLKRRPRGMRPKHIAEVLRQEDTDALPELTRLLAIPLRQQNRPLRLAQRGELTQGLRLKDTLTQRPRDTHDLLQQPKCHARSALHKA